LEVTFYEKRPFGTKENDFMNFFKKIEWNLVALAMVPFIGVETREKDRRLKERLQRSKQRQLNKHYS
jgi:hypothetical protein